MIPETEIFRNRQKQFLKTNSTKFFELQNFFQIFHKFLKNLHRWYITWGDKRSKNITARAALTLQCWQQCQWYMLHDMQVINTGKKRQADPNTVDVATVNKFIRINYTKWNLSQALHFSDTEAKLRFVEVATQSEKRINFTLQNTKHRRLRRLITPH